MRPCPSCGSYKRVELAPSFYECTALVAPSKDSATGEPVPCGVHYLDTSDRLTPVPLTPFGTRFDSLITSS